ncbi:hypothetical protein GZL_00358 [Streptomyces sp. 769]|nr:hypothetical protein GZL_00358 [Streptomyces sp. 769]
MKVLNEERAVGGVGGVGGPDIRAEPLAPTSRRDGRERTFGAVVTAL